MSAVLSPPETALPVVTGDFTPYTHEEFWQFCASYPDLRASLTAEGELVIMPPAGDESSNSNAELTTDVTNWNRKTRLGKVFDSSAGFTFPSGAVDSPDMSWIEKSRWEALPPEQRKKFAPICPDFAAELLSPSDSLTKTRAKMQAYLDNGLRLGWLLNPRDKTVEIYRLGREVEILQDPPTVSGEDVLPGFALDLSWVWGEKE